MSTLKTSSRSFGFGKELITAPIAKWKIWSKLVILNPPRLWNTGLVSSRASLTSWGEVASLSLVGHPSSDGVTIKMPYGYMFYIDQLRSPSFPISLVKTESDFIVTSVETGLERWTLVVAVITVDAYPFLAFSDLTCHLEDMGIRVFWLHCATW